ncbi:MAG: LysR family transcriptional regulator [Acidaminococcus intestini]
MELRVLRYFLAIAREENMTKAASVLHLTQPTLSRQIHQLEQELGTTLFIRNGHHIFLTASGMRLKQRAQDLVELADRTEAEMKQKEEIIAGEISLGIGETVNMVFLSRVMRSLRPVIQMSSFPFIRPLLTMSSAVWTRASLTLASLLNRWTLHATSFLNCPKGPLDSAAS